MQHPKLIVPTPDQIEALMSECLSLAEEAAHNGEVPVAALVWQRGTVLSRAHNEVEKRKDSTAHAEVLAIQQASQALNNWRLDDCILCVTLEPCTMCTGAMLQARIPAVVFAAPDPKAGGLGSLYDLSVSHSLRVIQGIKKEDSLNLLKAFFQAKRV